MSTTGTAVLDSILTKEKQYWTEKLSGCSANSSLSPDFQRSGTFTSELAPVALEPAVVREIFRICGGNERLLLAFAIAALDIALSNFTAENEVLVMTGALPSGSSQDDPNNILALRNHLDGEMQAIQFLGDVKNTLREAYENQSYPFWRIAKLLGIEADGDQFSVRVAAIISGDASFKVMNVTPDIMLKVSFSADEAIACFEFNAKLFMPSSIRMLAEQYREILHSIVSSPQLKLQELKKKAASCSANFVLAINGTEEEYGGGKCITEYIEEQVKERPEAVAVVGEGVVLSYQGLEGRANQVGHYLQKLGVGPEVLVGVCLERSVELLVVLLGIMKAGGAYLPLEPSYPGERLRYLVEDGKAEVVVSGKQWMEKVQWEGGREGGREGGGERKEGGGIGRVKYVDWEQEREKIWEQEKKEKPGCKAGAGNLAYVIYTSGSTGQPKGVMISQGAISNRLLWMKKEFGLDGGTVVVQKTVFSFDASVWELFVGLMAGGRVVMARAGGQQDSRYLVELMKEEEVGVLQAVPSMLQVLVEEEGLEECGNLRQVFSGGEALGVEVQERLWERLGTGVELVNLYGPTEASIDSSYYRCRESKGESRVAIGRPIGNVKLYVVDEEGELVGAGVAGELYIGGAGLGRGYRGRGGWTGERFVPDGYSGEAGGRLYRSGDRVRYRGDGELEYLGRVDEQVKIRGYRIEVGEIEAVLHGHGGVREAVVVVRDEGGESAGVGSARAGHGNGNGQGNGRRRGAGGGSGKRLVAYVAVEGEVKKGELKRYLQERLPEYMVPSAIEILREMPRLANGKMDRGGLPEPGLGERDEPAAAARGPVEEIIAGIWSEVLGLEQVGIHDNFFDLGGHSLTAIQMISRLRNIFHVDLPMRILFEHPVISELVVEIESNLGRNEFSESTITPVNREVLLPLSFAQERLWFIDQLEPGNPTYNLDMAVQMNGELNVSALDRSLSEIIRRHEVLRTSFADVAGHPVQRVSPAISVRIPVIDISRLDLEQRNAIVRQLIEIEAVRSFDLGRGPLLRAQLLRTGEQEHVALMTMHHIVSDGWSTGILVHELGELYKAYTKGERPTLQELNVQYADYSVWQCGRLQGEFFEKQMRYWYEQLAGMQEMLNLPTDRPRPKVQSYRGASVEFQLGEELTRKLKELSVSEGATLFMMLVAGFNALLYRYTAQKDIGIGIPVANRNHLETENMIGFFVNTLVLRTGMAGDLSFRELLRHVRQTALEAHMYQDMPFEKIVERLQPERDLSRSALFQVMCSFQALSTQTLQLSGLRVAAINRRTTISKFDLTLNLIQTEKFVEASFEYSTDLFNQSTIERMAGHWRMLLEAAVSNPDARLSELRLLSHAEWQQIVVGWNSDIAEYPLDKCVHQLIEDQVKTFSGATAVAQEGRSLSYAELNQRANQLAHYLLHFGIAPEDRIGICLPRSLEMVIAVLAVWKAGAAYVPLDVASPQHRINQILSDAGVKLLIANEDLGIQPQPSVEAILYLDRLWNEVARENDANPKSNQDPANLAYVIYTSGSTGQPKGVAIAHRNLMSACKSWEIGYNLLSRTSSHLQMANFTFDVFVGNLIRTLCFGKKLVICPLEYLLEPRRLYEYMQQNKIDFAEFVPAVSRQFVDCCQRNGFRLESVDLGVLGSDSLSSADLCGLQQVFPNARILNSYGVTECTVDSSFYACKKTANQKTGAHDFIPPIGKPMVNTRIYVLDEDLSPVPVGVRGQIYIGGCGVARGYWQQPVLTADRFLPDPFGTEAGSRIYRSGDSARYLSDGNIEFLGRIDFQVKIRGYRIELGEIEGVLNQHGSVRQGRVMVWEEEGGGEKRLVGYVVKREEERGSRNEEELRRYLQERLPGYMVPGEIVEVEEMPLTSNGKLDRKRLPRGRAEGRGGAGEGEKRDGKETMVEEILMGIWSEVLGKERVGVEDDFFQMGGHSLLATQVISRVRSAFGREVPLRGLFENPTVRGLGGYVEGLLLEGEERGGGRARMGVKGVKGVGVQEREQGVRLSYAQERLWFLEQLESGEGAYNIGTGLRLKGKLEVGALEKSIGEIMRRHEVLRTEFVEERGRGVQRVRKPESVRVPVVDVSGLEEEEREAEVVRLVKGEGRRGFDLKGGRVVRGQLVRVGEQEHVALLSMHHIVSDGWSMGIVVREMGQLYGAYVEGKESPLAELEVQYGDYAEWQREWLEGGELKRQMEYWRGQLRGMVEMMELPLDHMRPKVQSYRGGSVRFEIGKEVGRELKELGRRNGATLFMVLLGAWQSLLYRYTGEGEVVVGTPIANRNRVETEGLIGFFVNTLVLRGRVRGEERFTELLREVREMALEAHLHQDVPFEKLVEELQPERDMGRSPLFQVLFVLQNVPEEVLELGQLQVSGVELAEETAKFDLSLGVEENGDGSLRGALEYRADLFERGTVVRMVEHWKQLLTAVSRNAEQRIGELEMLGAGERRQVLEEWNRTEVEYGRGKCIHELIEEQAQKTPEAEAVIGEEERISYRELNRRANQLGHYLRQQGVRAEVLVGVCMERSVGMVVVLLGILKAGAAYLPLDPGYPEERLRYMVEDAGAGVVVVERSVAERLGGIAGKMVVLEEEKDRIEQASEEKVESGVREANLAYMIYTSGSTGRPKGAMNTHGGIGNRLEWMQREYGLGSQDRVLQKTPYSFDVSVWEFFWPLLSGAGLVVARAGGHRDSGYLVEVMEREKVTTVHFVPSMMEAFLEEEGVERLRKSLKRVISSGEALSVELEERFGKRLAGVELHNLYGPTEAAVDVSYWRCEAGGESTDESAEKEEKRKRRSVPIGRPIGNMEMYVLDEEMRPTGIGVRGEIYLGGVGLGRGYWRRAGLTGEKFVPHPYGKQGGERLYRSGDLGRYLEEGVIEYLGRKDEQVKIRGYRIELGEIEQVLNEHAGVRSSAVVVREQRGQKRLVGYVVREAREGKEVSAEELKSYLRERLPEYMVPGVWMMLKELPLSPNGKLERKALPQPEEQETGSREPVEVRTEVEGVLAGIWAEVLGREEVGVEDNFFELGGDSILSIQVVARARQRGLEVNLQQLFQHQTVEELARVAGRKGAGVVEGGGEKPGSGPFSLVGEEDRKRLPEGVEDAYPLAMLQLGMVYHMELTPDSPVYHNVDTMHLKGQWEAEVFQNAVDEAVRRHGNLRTGFDMSSYSEPLQLVWVEAKLEVGVEDLRGLEEKEQEERIEAYVKSEQQNRFDLGKPPLLRLQVHRRSEQSFQLTLTECHAVQDGWSLHATLAEIFTDYLGRLRGEAKQPEKPVRSSFREFVQVERAALENEKSRSYWEEKLHGYTPVELPQWAEKDKGGVQDRDLAVNLPAEVTAGLKQLARQAAVPLKTVLLAAHLKATSLLTGEQDIVTGLPVHGRLEEEGGEQVRGLFLNVVPFRQQIRSGSWKDLVRQTFQNEWEMLPHRRYPMAVLQKNWGNQLLYDISFLFTNFHVVDSLLNSREIEVLTFTANDPTHWAFTAHFNMFGSTLSVSMFYDSKRISQIQIERIAGYYRKILESMSAQPLQTHDSMCPLSESEQQLLLEKWNQTAVSYGEAESVCELIEEQVRRTPQAMAVVHKQGGLNYQELNRRANQLARYLKNLGIGPEVLVGICMEPSLEMVVAVLGVLKSGGAYVPLDPNYPAERLQYMLEDAQIMVLLTEQHLQGRLPTTWGVQVLALDQEWEEIGQGEGEDFASGVVKENLGYVIYTSGSTGKPKGVGVTHAGLLNYLNWVKSSYGGEKARNSLVHSSLSFDLTVTSLYGPLLWGGTIKLVGEGGDVEGVKEGIVEGGEPLVKITPSHLQVLREMMQEGEEGEGGVWVIGGEALKYEDVRRWQEAGGGGERKPRRRLINEYGPTETVVGCCVYEVEGREESWEKAGAIPIGKPIGNMQMYVLDEGMNAVPVGVAGELYIGGAGVARGYWRRGGQTGERFVPNPYGGEGERLYRTGDRGRYLEDGNIVYLGRIDQQIKLRGYRIELGEIEAALREYSDLADGAVIVRADKGQPRLVGFVVPREKSSRGTFSVAELKEFLSHRLPDYMVPTVYVTLPSLPLSPTGKLDRQALELHTIEEGEAPAKALPENFMEFLVFQIWKDIFGMDTIGVEDDFFQIGGDSITAVLILARIRQELRCDLPLSTIIEKGTVRQLAETVSHMALNATPSSHLVKLRASETGKPIFFMHPVGGGVLIFNLLARYLAPAFSSYGLQAIDVEDPDINIKQLAATYVEEIRKVQPEGPYFLAGFSFGGLVAYEIAQQLQQQGQEIRLLALIESSWAPHHYRQSKDFAPEIDPVTFVHDAFQIYGINGNVSVNWEHLKTLAPDEQISYVVELCMAGGFIPPEIEVSRARRALRNLRSRIAAIKKYNPEWGPLAATLLFVQSVDPDPASREADPSHGWKDLCSGPQDLQLVSAEHFAIMQDPANVEFIAQQIAKYA